MLREWPGIQCGWNRGKRDKREWVGLEVQWMVYGCGERFGLGFHFHSPPHQVTWKGQDIRAGGGGRGGCGNCPTGATWWGKGLDSGCIFSSRATGLAIRTLPGGRGRHGCQRCSSLERWLKAQQSAPSGGWWGSPVSSPPASLPARTQVGIKTCEAASIEDATDTVRGLVMELSNLK